MLTPQMYYMRLSLQTKFSPLFPLLSSEVSTSRQAARLLALFFASTWQIEQTR